MAVAGGLASAACNAPSAGSSPAPAASSASKGSALTLSFGEPTPKLPTDQASLQALIDARIPPCGVCSNDKGGSVRFSGVISLSSPLKLYSGITLEGVGPDAVLQAAPGFQGTEVISLVGIPAGTARYYANGALRNFTILGPSTGAVAAISVSPAESSPTEPSANLTNGILENLIVGAPLGIRLNYAQHFVLRNLQLLASVPVAQFIELRGNHNLLENIDASQANLVDTSRPLLSIKRSWAPSARNTLRTLRVSGAAPSGKRTLLIEDALGTVLEDVSFDEVSAEAPLEFRNCSGATARHLEFHGDGPSVILDNARITLDRLNLGDRPLRSAVLFKPGSWLIAEVLVSRQGAASVPLSLPVSVITHEMPPPTPSIFQNPKNPLDVNNDGFVSPLDPLTLLDFLNTQGSRALIAGKDTTPPYLDVNGDGFVSPLDVLKVTDHLNAKASQQ
jgi:hypothetical protein